MANFMAKGKKPISRATFYPIFDRIIISNSSPKKRSPEINPLGSCEKNSRRLSEVMAAQAKYPAGGATSRLWLRYMQMFIRLHGMYGAPQLSHRAALRQLCCFFTTKDLWWYLPRKKYDSEVCIGFWVKFVCEIIWLEMKRVYRCVSSWLAAETIVFFSRWNENFWDIKPWLLKGVRTPSSVCTYRNCLIIFDSINQNKNDSLSTLMIRNPRNTKKICGMGTAIA